MDNSVPLNRYKISSTKVQDFRNVKEVKKLNINLAIFENSLMTQKNSLKLKTNDNTDVRKKKIYFTDVHISRDSDGSARLAFGLDFKQYIKDNSIYGKLFDNNSSVIRKGIFKSAKIRTMKIYRRRIKNVQTLNRLGSPWHGEVIWDRDETPVLLAISGERNHKDFRSIENDRGSLKEISYMMRNSSDMEDMRFFTAMDKTVKNITYGHYQYGIELEVEDGSFNYLSNWVQKLLNYRKDLYEYYLRGTKIGMTKKLAVVDDPHIDHEAERLAEQSQTSGAYEPTSNRFTKEFFIKEMKTWEGKEDESPWIKPAFEYLTAVHLMTGSLPVGERFFKLAWSLGALVNPQTGNPKGVMALIGMYDDLISKIQRVLAVDSGTRTVRTIEAPRHPQTGVKGKTSKTPVKIFKDTKWFTNLSFDADLEKNVGLHYIWTEELGTANNTDGLKEVDGGYYETRVNMETKKYFKSLDVVPNLYAASKVYTDGDSLSATNFTFLSPSLIGLPNSNMKMIAGSMTTEPYSNDYYSIVESCMLAYNSGQDTSNEYNMGGFFADLNTTVLPIDGWEPIDQAEQFRPHAALTEETIELDPIVEIHTSCHVSPTIDANSNPNSVFLGLSQHFLAKGASENSNPFVSTSKTKGKLGVSNSRSNDFNFSMTTTDANTIEMFNLNGNKNIVSFMAQDKEMASSICRSNGHNDVPATIKSALLTLPNQIKSILLASTSPNLVKNKWHQYGFDPVKNFKTAARFRLNYQFIARIDYLVGYRKSTDKRYVKSPIWKPMTAGTFYSSSGEAILCRLQRYVCPQLGIRPPPGLALPMYDEYFVLTPPVRTIPSSSTATTESPTATLLTTFGGHYIDEGPGKFSTAFTIAIRETEPEYTHTNPCEL